MKVGRRDRGDHEARGNPHHPAAIRSTICIEHAASGGHPPDHRAPGAHRPAHGRRDLPPQLRAQDRRLLHAARPGHRERLWRHRPGLRRICSRSWCCPAGYPAPHRPCRRPTSTRSRNCAHITKSAEPLTAAREIAEHLAPRLRAACATAAAARSLVEIPADVFAEEIPDDFDYAPVAATRYGPDPQAVERSRQASRRSQAPGDLCRPGRALGARPGTQLRRLAERLAAPGHHEPRRQERLPRGPSALARLGRRAMPEDGARTSSTNADVIFGIGCSFTETDFRRRHAQGQDHYPRHARPRSISTRTFPCADRARRRRRARRSHALYAALRGPPSRSRATRRPSRARSQPMRQRLARANGCPSSPPTRRRSRPIA